MEFRRALLLIVALVVFALPTSGTAQAPRRASSPLQTATRALIEGKYDEVDVLRKLDGRDPAVVALKKLAPRSSAGATRRRSDAAAGRLARADQRSRAGSACCRDARQAGCGRHPEPRPRRRRRHRRPRDRARRPRPPRPGRVSDAGLSRRGLRPAERSRHQYRMGRSLSREGSKRRSAPVMQSR